MEFPDKLQKQTKNQEFDDNIFVHKKLHTRFFVLVATYQRVVNSGKFPFPSAFASVMTASCFPRYMLISTLCSGCSECSECSEYSECSECSDYSGCSDSDYSGCSNSSEVHANIHLETICVDEVSAHLHR
jgi:hypothetical protein